MPPKSAAPAVPAKPPQSLPPNQTLYITNLPSAKIQKTDLRLSLYTLFSTYGPVLDVIALKTIKMRGQAHVVFRDIQSATQAMRALDGFNFFGLDMKISYARTKSHTVAKLDGTFQKPAAAGEVTATELQQSIFNAPPSSISTLPPKPILPPPVGLPKPPIAQGLKPDVEMGDAGASPAATIGSVAGQKRRRDDEDESEEEAGDGSGSEGDAAMEEDSDDD